MSGFSNSPRLVKGGIVLVDSASGAIPRVISLQYNPDSLTRTLQVQATRRRPGSLEALRFKGPAVETFKLEADIDATDQLEFPDQNPNAGEFGIQPQLALLETLVQPTARQLQSRQRWRSSGTLEIAPMLAPLALFVWSKSRIVPVDHRLQHHRGSLRPGAQSDPRQGEPRPARAVASTTSASTHGAAASSWPTCRARSSSRGKVQPASSASSASEGSP